MQTKILTSSQEDIKEAGRLLRRGGLVAIPTETVYGLAANALMGEAVTRIFEAKGRPQDNPLIVHIADFVDIESLVLEIPQQARLLAKAFWPGPLTMVLPKSDRIPKETSGGLATVGIRFPSHPVAAAVIRAAGVPLAAPSANLSGSPSPTTAHHVEQDLLGRIDAIVDGGPCQVGVESTVITLAEGTPRLLRPGGVTLDQLQSVLGRVEVDHAVLHRLEEGAKASSPGMKYKHYAPSARVILVKGASYVDYVNRHAGDGVAALCYQEDGPQLHIPYVSFGAADDDSSQARELFDALRRLDEEGAKLVYARCPHTDGMGMAVYNRLIRAAGFEVLSID